MTLPGTILTVLVGSRAHGLADEASDYDYRSVFVHRTSELLKIRTRTSPQLKDASWEEKVALSDEPLARADVFTKDETAWELGKFLGLSVHCNPTILECFAAPTAVATKDGILLQDLFGHVWHPTRVRDAFLGYACNQRKKFLDGFSPEGKRERGKYAAALVRAVVQAEWLLRRETLLVNLMLHPEIDFLRRIRRGEFGVGEVVEFFEKWKALVEEAHEKCRHAPDIDKVNEFLLRVRRENW